MIGLFLYMGAGGEKHHTMMRAVLRQIPAQTAMATTFVRLAPTDRLSRVLEQIYHGCQDDFPVVTDDKVQGILTRVSLLSALHEKGTETAVADIMDPNFVRITPVMPLDEVYRLLVSQNKSAAAVLEGDELRGMLGLEGIGRYFMIQMALRGVPIIRQGICATA